MRDDAAIGAAGETRGDPGDAEPRHVEYPVRIPSRKRGGIHGNSGVTPSSAGAGGHHPQCVHFRGPTGPVIFLGILLLALLAVPAWAFTPPGTIISNTAEIGYALPTTGSIVTTRSNTVDTTVEQGDTEGPVLGLLFATPSPATNGNATVLLTVSVADSSPLDTVLINLSSLGFGESIPLRNDGVLPDTVAGDGIWNLWITLDSTVIGDTHLLRVLARDALGNTTTGVLRLVVIDTSPSFGLIRTLGWNLRDDIRIAGDAVSIALGYSDTFSAVRFEYRPASGGSWRPCTTGAWSGPNPDTYGPYWGIYWNTDLLAEDTYLVRAVATRSDGSTDPSPSHLRVIVSRTDSWIHEYTDTVAGRHIRRHRFTSDSSDTAMLSEASALRLDTTSFGALSAVWTRITIFPSAPAEAPAPPASALLVQPTGGAYRRFEREDGQSLWSDWVRISIPYDDQNLTCPESDLGIFRYDVSLGAWIQEHEDFHLDTVRNIASVKVRHFTDFAVFGVTVGANLDAVLIYPNPYVPYDGDPQTGSPFVRGDNTTGIIFKNVTSSVDIDIYNVAGRKVASIRASNTGGNVQWDARTDDGREAASGVYIAVLKAPNGQQVVKKFMVIR